MRRSRLFLTFTIPAIFGSIVHVACSGDDGREHGPSFTGDDGGTSSDGKISSGDGSEPRDDGSVLADGAIACATGSVAVVGGGASGSFAAEATGDQALTAQAFTAHVVALPAIAAFGGGYQAVLHVGGSNALFATSFSGSTWSAPAVIAGTLVRESPALAVEGTMLHLLYQANDDAGADEFKYFHGTYASSWTVGDPVGSGVDQSSGPHAIGAAGIASELVTGQVGGNTDIYARSWNGSWQSSVDIAMDAGSNNEQYGSPAQVVALNGSAAELLLVYTRLGDYKLMSITRTSGTWQTSPTLANANAYTTEPFQLAAIAGGKAIATWRGSTDAHGYAST
ncbi:MAG: hypothetical protein ACRELY_00455, partial [Polyangiaceae bacterium]